VTEIENAAPRWGPGDAALEGAEKEPLNNSDSTTNVVPLPASNADIELDGKIWPLIPDGEYIARYHRHDTQRMFGTLKVFLHFEILDPGPYNGTRLYRAYRAVDVVHGKKGGRRFKLRPRSQLYLDLCRLYGGNHRRDRISLTALKSLVLRVRVRTVEKDYRQRPLPEALKYSVVGDLLGVEAGAQNV
jgi:hypothetical protein